MACPTGKVPHASREAAEAHQKKLVWKNHISGESERSKGLNVYPCPQCGAWHVGHSQAETMPLVYHYTTGLRVEDILAADELRPRNGKRINKAINEPNPMLWFSWNPEWEYSVIKDPRPRGQRIPPTGRAITELFGEGLVRFSAPASVAKLRWNDYLARNITPLWQREAMAKRGNPVDWLATDQPVSLDACRTFEVWYRGQWVNGGLVPDADFEAYLAQRKAVYHEAWMRLLDKLIARAPKDTKATEADDLLEVALAAGPCEPPPFDNDAEWILYEDYRVAQRERTYLREHLEEIKKDIRMSLPPLFPPHGGKKRKKKKR